VRVRPVVPHLRFPSRTPDLHWLLQSPRRHSVHLYVERLSHSTLRTMREPFSHASLMPHSERRRCGKIAVLGRLVHQHTALASGLMDLRPPFSTATTLVGVACKRAERRCARPRRAPSNWPMVDVLGREYGTAATKAKLTAAPPPVDRTCARHRTSLRCGCHFHLVPRGSTLSARPLHMWPAASPPHAHATSTFERDVR